MRTRIYYVIYYVYRVRRFVRQRDENNCDKRGTSATSECIYTRHTLDQST